MQTTAMSASNNPYSANVAASAFGGAADVSSTKAHRPPTSHGPNQWLFKNFIVRIRSAPPRNEIRRPAPIHGASIPTQKPGAREMPDEMYGITACCASADWG